MHEVDPSLMRLRLDADKKPRIVCLLALDTELLYTKFGRLNDCGACCTY